MFRFAFSDTDQKSESFQEKIDWKKCEEVVYEKNLYTKDAVKNENIKSIVLSNFVLKYLSHNSAMELLNNFQDVKESSILKAEQTHTDLVPALYEGGLKVWECTHDILNYLNETPLAFDNKHCLDLGCGSGLLGTYCLLQGAISYFQDYNIEVIKYLTIPNVVLNQNNLVNCKFYAGDWGSFTDLLANDFDDNNKFDYIFTSETIYNVDNYPKLCNVFKSCMKKTGTIFLGAKSHYFGVGGGIAPFQKYLDGVKIFKYETLWENSEGVKRSILKISFI